ncbi:MAG: hypothetical protein JWM34_259 [Ilumatobacteraceae bacterium]|nr:hypothetical protein [Ilumatobacteraceae bacterium]
MSNDDVSFLHARIAMLEGQIARLYQHLAIPVPSSEQIYQSGMPTEISDLARQGKVIDAIKLHRQMFGSSLAEAKAAVEGIAAAPS